EDEEKRNPLGPRQLPVKIAAWGNAPRNSLQQLLQDPSLHFQLTSVVLPTGTSYTRLPWSVETKKGKGNKLERPRGLRDPSSPLFLFPFPVFFSRREPRLPVPRLAGDSSSKSLLFTTRGGRRSNPSTIHLVSKGAFKENFSSSPQPLSSL